MIEYLFEAIKIIIYYLLAMVLVFVALIGIGYLFDLILGVV